MKRRPSIASVGWRKWLDTHPSPEGWGSREFDILAGFGTPVSVLSRLWKKDRRMIETYLREREKEKV